MCNCGIEAKKNFLLESLAACHDAESKLVIYFMVNTAFVNFLDNLTESLKFPILFNRTNHEQTLPIALELFDFDSDLPKAPLTLKDLIHQFWHKKENFDLTERHNNNNLELANKYFFFNNYTVDWYNFISGYNSSYIYYANT